VNDLSPQIRSSARALIAQRLGLSFPERRDAELVQSLLLASRRNGTPDVGRYVSLLEALPSDAPEWRLLASHLTVGETYFLRDRRCFDALEHDVLKPLIDRRRTDGLRRLRVWSAGCATGEEPYSLAILLDRLLPDRADWSVTILATDLNPHALSVARRGEYREWSLRDTPEWVRDRYFLPRPTGTFELDPAIRAMVSFAPLNLAEDSYPSHLTNTRAMDLVLCRNVLMYFTCDAQRDAVGRLQQALVNGGWLVLSPAESSAELMRPLRPVNLRGAILHRKGPEPHDGAAPRVRRPARVPSRPPAARQVARRPTAPAAASEGADASQAEASALLEDARSEADRGNLEHARQLCQAAASRDRLDVDAYLLLAAIEQERGELVPAVEAVRRAIYVAPECASAHFLLGSLLFRQRQTRKGLRSMATVVGLLDGVPSDVAVPRADGMAAGRLLESARGYLESA
jgi:chemotaxis protein methyltransferase CheR